MKRTVSTALGEVFAYIDNEFPRFVAELQEACRLPSISSKASNMQEMADLLVTKMQDIGIESQIMSLSGSFPFIYGEATGRSDSSLLFYNHYDVQPVEPLDRWEGDPFAAELRDGKLFARGTADNKGCLLSRIHAVEAWYAVNGQLPITVKFLIEGEEEIGSPNLVEFVHLHKKLLESDACVWEYSSKDEDDNPTVRLGNKGLCHIELTAYGANSDIHSMYAPILPNPAWELTWALSTLKDRDERILIEGFYDDIEPISDAEEEVLRTLPFNEANWKRRTGLDRLLGDLPPRQLTRRLFTEPTFNINGITSGYTGADAKTIIPDRASATLDIRLVPRQDPEDIFRKVKRHLQQKGFGHIDVRLVGKFIPSKTAVTSPLVEIVTEAGNKAYEREMLVEPISPASGPRYSFSTWTDMPIVALGVAYMGSQIHAPDENIRLEDYREGVRHIAALIEELSMRR